MLSLIVRLLRHKHDAEQHEDEVEDHVERQAQPTRPQRLRAQAEGSHSLRPVVDTRLQRVWTALEL